MNLRLVSVDSTRVLVVIGNFEIEVEKVKVETIDFWLISSFFLADC